MVTDRSGSSRRCREKIRFLRSVFEGNYFLETTCSFQVLKWWMHTERTLTNVWLLTLQRQGWFMFICFDTPTRTEFSRPPPIPWNVILKCNEYTWNNDIYLQNYSPKHNAYIAYVFTACTHSMAYDAYISYKNIMWHAILCFTISA